MFLPARMTRVLLGGHQAHMEGAIDTLHEVGVVHLEDYVDAQGLTSIGTPLDAGDELSELLLRTRGMQKSIGAENMAPRVQPTKDPAGLLQEVDDATKSTLEELAAARSDLTARESEINVLEPFSGLKFELSATNLESVKGYFGTARAVPTLSVSCELDSRPHGSGVALALYVRTKDAAIADKALQDVGFTPSLLPAGAHGTPDQRLAELAANLRELEARVRAAEAQLEVLREMWGPRLAALERHLRLEVDKTQAPLQFGVTERTFHVEGWVPVGNVGDLKEKLQGRFGNSIYFEELGDAPVKHGHGDAHGDDAHGHDDHDDHHVDPADEAPVHLNNPKAARPYQYLLGLLGRPRYGEVDPSRLMLLFFPLFFGLMVGDVIIGAAIVGVGAFLNKNKVFGIGGPAISKSIMAGGFVSILVGAFIFGEALGMHFVLDEHSLEAGEYSWESVIYGLDESGHLNGHFPHEGFFHKTGHDAAHVGDAAAGAMVTHASEVEEHAPAMFSPESFAPHSDTHLKAGPVPLGIYSKTHDAQALLQWGAVIGLVHVILGLLVGVRNFAKNHGVAMAIYEKVSWLGIIAGAAIAINGMLGEDSIFLGVGAGLFVLSLALLWIGVAKTIGQGNMAMGFIAVLEVPSLVTNILSYTRLAAIGASKAGMAIAFASISFGMIGGGDPTITGNIGGWLVYILASGLILVLAIIAGTLQSLRLQFVEFFGKFFEGGGRPYVPFGRRAP